MTGSRWLCIPRLKRIRLGEWVDVQIQIHNSRLALTLYKVMSGVDAEVSSAGPRGCRRAATGGRTSSTWSRISTSSLCCFCLGQRRTGWASSSMAEVAAGSSSRISSTRRVAAVKIAPVDCICSGSADLGSRSRLCGSGSYVHCPTSICESC